MANDSRRCAATNTSNKAPSDAGFVNRCASSVIAQHSPLCGHWFRSYGNENWEFDETGLMRLRIASINDAPIKESDRKFHWPLGRRPDDHPSLSELGL